MKTINIMSKQEIEDYKHNCKAINTEPWEGNIYKCGTHKLYHIPKKVLDYHKQVIKHK